MKPILHDPPGKNSLPPGKYRYTRNAVHYISNFGYIHPGDIIEVSDFQRKETCIWKLECPGYAVFINHHHPQSTCFMFGDEALTYGLVKIEE